jgi:hypothetical protein
MIYGRGGLRGVESLMPIEVAWKDEAHDVVLRSYHGRWTEDDLNAAEVTINTMIESVGHRVDLITDIRGSNTFPPNLSGLFESYHTRRHPRIELIVAVGREINYDLMTLLAEKYPGFLRLYAFATSLEEAEQIIADDRAGTRRRGEFPAEGNLN